jgi:hypothetical protein
MRGSRKRHRCTLNLQRPPRRAERLLHYVFKRHRLSLAALQTWVFKPDKYAASHPSCQIENIVESACLGGGGRWLERDLRLHGVGGCGRLKSGLERVMVVGMGGAWWLRAACFRWCCGCGGVGWIGWYWRLWRVEEQLRESHGVGEAWGIVLGGGLLSHWWLPLLLCCMFSR